MTGSTRTSSTRTSRAGAGRSGTGRAGQAPRARRLCTVLALSGALAGTLGGCGSANPDYYTITSWPGQAQGGGPLTLKVRTPSVASFLDRDYIVRNDRNYRLKLDRDAAWAEPVADLIGRALTEDLQQRLPGTTVFAASGAITTDAQAVVEVNVTQFAEDHDGNPELDAALSVHRVGSTLATSQLLHLTTPPQGTGTAAFAAALSRLLGELADAAAHTARALGPQPPPVDLAGG